jgi:hypothetical protein
MVITTSVLQSMRCFWQIKARLTDCGALMGGKVFRTF